MYRQENDINIKKNLFSKYIFLNHHYKALNHNLYIAEIETLMN